MAKNKRFPSPANPSKSAPKAEAAPEAVKGKSQNLVQVEYKKDNHHILGMGVYALRKGVNHVPASVWEAAKNHPSIVAMVKAGHIVAPQAASAAKAVEEEEAPKDEPASDESEEKDSE